MKIKNENPVLLPLLNSKIPEEVKRLLKTYAEMIDEKNEKIKDLIFAQMTQDMVVNKLQLALKAQDEYIKFLVKKSDDTFPFLCLHGWEYPSGVLETGDELRYRIAKSKEALQSYNQSTNKQPFKK
jgi:hypothetical protein